MCSDDSLLLLVAFKKETNELKASPSLPGGLRTPTGTMTVGGGEPSTPEAWACCRGGMVEQYSAGLLGLGLWLLPAV